MLFLERKVKADWINVYNFANEKNDKIHIVCEYLNGCSEIELQEIINTFDNEDDSFQLLNLLIIQKELSINSFKFLASLLDFEKNSFDFSSFATEKITFLLMENLIPLTNHNFTQLKNMGNGFHRHLAKNHKQDFISKIADYEFSIRDLEILLRSNDWIKEEKELVLKNFDSGQIVSDQITLQILVNGLISENRFNINDDLLYQVLISINISNEERIEISEKYSDKLNDSILPAFLKSLGGDFPLLLSEGDFEVSFNNDMEALLRILRKIKYIKNYQIKKDKIEVYK
jgi:hypothetical protein